MATEKAKIQRQLFNHSKILLQNLDAASKRSSYKDCLQPLPMSIHCTSLYPLGSPAVRPLHLTAPLGKVCHPSTAPHCTPCGSLPSVHCTSRQVAKSFCPVRCTSLHHLTSHAIQRRHGCIHCTQKNQLVGRRCSEVQWIGDVLL